MKLICNHYTKPKGQIISKANYGILNSSKKRTIKFYFTSMIPQVDLFSFVFWRKLKTPKRLSEINWHLLTAFCSFSKNDDRNEGLDRKWSLALVIYFSCVTAIPPPLTSWLSMLTYIMGSKSISSRIQISFHACFQDFSGLHTRMWIKLLNK